MYEGILRNFTKFTGKHLCQSLFFNKVAGLSPQACKFIKKEALAQVFSCDFAKYLKTLFLQNTSGGCFCSQFLYKLNQKFRLSESVYRIFHFRFCFVFIKV